MQNKRIVFTGPGQIELQHDETDLTPQHEYEVIVKTHYSLISAGTELACLSGSENWFKFPGTPGYTSVGEVVAAGQAVTHVALGEVVYVWGGHSAYTRIDLKQPSALCLKVPDGIAENLVPFARIATIAMTSLRISEIELGDYVAVVGMGLVGNLAVQLARLQGAFVIAVDLSEKRLARAAECGASSTLQVNGTDTVTRLRALTEGRGVSTLIEATGIPSVVPDILPFVSKYGEVILLGSPRGQFETDLTPVLNYVHLDPRGCLTFKGAHEWRYPVHTDPFVKHSIERNSQIALTLIKLGSLKIRPVLTHILRPEEAEKAYDGLRKQKDDFVGVVFNWLTQS
jgi:2-desacetyl-2-hydroxyethyl bacteriochlorophyllide A dehydrogenase